MSTPWTHTADLRAALQACPVEAARYGAAACAALRYTARGDQPRAAQELRPILTREGRIV